jgi:hypothetical protein
LARRTVLFTRRFTRRTARFVLRTARFVLRVDLRAFLEARLALRLPALFFRLALRFFAISSPWVGPYPDRNPTAEQDVNR